MDLLKIYSGDCYTINDKISIRQPTLREIKDYGEEEYNGIVSIICSTPADRKVDIWDSLHIFWDEMDEFELFTSLFNAIKTKDLGIIFGELDVSSFKAVINPKTKEIVLRNKDGVIIDRAIHAMITDCLRKIHQREKNVDVGFDRYTKEVMIEDDRDERDLLSTKPYSSFFVPLISSMTNTPEFKYGFFEVWDMPVGVFMDAVCRVKKRINYGGIMAGIYSGCVDVKKINKKDLNWMLD